MWMAKELPSLQRNVSSIPTGEARPAGENIWMCKLQHVRQHDRTRYPIVLTIHLTKGNYTQLLPAKTN